jgi:O-antigen ligase
MNHSKQSDQTLVWFKRLLLLSPLIFIFYLTRLHIGPLPTNVLELYTGALLLFWIFGLWKLDFQIPQFHRKSSFIIISLFVLSFVIATVTTVINLPPEHIKVPLGILKGWVLAPALLYLMISSTFRTKKDLQLLIDSFIASLSLVALISLIQYITGIFPGPSATYDLRLVWPYLDPWTGEGASANYPALFLSPPLMLAFFSLFKKEGEDKVTNKLFYLTCTLVLTITIYFTKSFGAWLSIIAASSLIIVLRSKHKFVTIALSFILLLLLILSQWSTEKFQWALKTDGDSSTSERIRIWKVSWEMIKESPLTGIGLGQFQTQFELQSPAILGREVTRKEINHALHAHNTPLMFWASTGLLGLISFTLLLLCWLIGIPKRYRFLLLAPFAYLIIHGLIDVFYFKNDLAFSFWFLGSLITVSKNSSIISGHIVHGIKKGRELGFPTANLNLDIHPDVNYGVHLVEVKFPGKKRRGLLYFGPRMTKGLPESIVCEVTILDYSGDLSGKKMNFGIIKKLREPMSFKSPNELKEQIEKDFLIAKNIKI